VAGQALSLEAVGRIANKFANLLRARLLAGMPLLIRFEQVE
jgi:hypothetical protein